MRHRIWQPGAGYDRNITRTSTLRSTIERVHGNRVRRELDAKAEDWEWSSARGYARIRPVPLAMNVVALEELSRDWPRWAERFPCSASARFSQSLRAYHPPWRLASTDLVEGRTHAR